MSQAGELPPPAHEAGESWLDRMRPAIIADGGNVALFSVDRVSEARNESGPARRRLYAKDRAGPHTQYARL